MNMIYDGVTYRMEKTVEAHDFIQYNVYKGDVLQGHITKGGAEILYTATDALGKIKGMGATLREALENMILNTFYFYTFKGERKIETLGKWVEGEKIKVEFVKNEIVKRGERVVKYDRTAGDLYIMIDNGKYFYHEFE